MGVRGGLDDCGSGRFTADGVVGDFSDGRDRVRYAGIFDELLVGEDFSLAVVGLYREHVVDVTRADCVRDDDWIWARWVGDFVVYSTGVAESVEHGAVLVTGGDCGDDYYRDDCGLGGVVESGVAGAEDFWERRGGTRRYDLRNSEII